MDQALMDALAPLQDSQTWQELVQRAVPALGARSAREAEQVLLYALGGGDLMEEGVPEGAPPAPGLAWAQALLQRAAAPA